MESATRIQGAFPLAARIRASSIFDGRSALKIAPMVTALPSLLLLALLCVPSRGAAQQRLAVVSDLPRGGHWHNEAYDAWRLRGVALALTSAVNDTRIAAAKLLADHAELRQQLAELSDATRTSLSTSLSSSLRQLLDEQSDSATRAEAAAALATLGENAKDAVPDLLRVLRDRDEDIYFRASAASALGEMGASAKDAIPDLLGVLKDKGDGTYFRISAAEALGKIGTSTTDAARDLLRVLKDKDEDIYFRGSAAEALGKMGITAKDAVPDLLRVLKDRSEDTYLRGSATSALGEMGTSAKDTIPDLLRVLKDKGEDRSVRRSAAGALSVMGASARDTCQDLLRLLEEDSSVREPALYALGKMGANAKDAVPYLLRLLRDKGEDRDVRQSAAWALGGMATSAKGAVQDLLHVLKDKGEDTNVRMSAADALGEIGAGTKDAVRDLIRVLEDRDPVIRESAAEALGKMGASAKDAVRDLIRALKDEDRYVRSSAAAALGNIGENAKEAALPVASWLTLDDNAKADDVTRLTMIGPPPERDRVAIAARLLDLATRRADLRGEALLAAYVQSSGERNTVLALRWLEAEKPPPLASTEDVRSTLSALYEMRNTTEAPELRRLTKDRLEEAVSEGMKRAFLGRSDRHLLEAVVASLEPDHSSEIEEALHKLDVFSRISMWGRRLAGSLAGHLLFWCLLWFGYVRSRMVQTVFFWNKWVRRFVGLGYVGFLLTWVPALRRRLLRPFEDGLLAEAELDRHELGAYFDKSRACSERDKKVLPVTELIAHLSGKVLLVGESGLGKTEFVRHLLRAGRKGGPVAAYLPARLCSKGVLEAVQEKLLGHARDTGFLLSILGAGALDVYIDGLNEVGLSTRERIAEFARRPGTRNLMLVTEPLDWELPGSLKAYRLLPLDANQLLEFAKSRWPSLSEHATVTEEDFMARCEAMVQDLSAKRLPAEPKGSSHVLTERVDAGGPSLDEEALRILSNPMDLTTATELIAGGETPNVGSLYEQQVSIVARTYKDEHLTDFPLQELAQRAYEMRERNETSIPQKGLEAAIKTMGGHRLVIRRHMSLPSETGTQDSVEPHWVFRHDKVQDLFVAQALRSDRERQKEHLGDPRFRGAYLMLAQHESLETARAIERLLIEYAAKTKDHTLSDDFVNLLVTRARNQASDSRHSPASLENAGA